MKRNKIILLLVILTLLLTLLLTACGKTGKNDKNEIYNIYLSYAENGGTLTYEDWLSSIKGEKGDVGPAGKDGLSAYEIFVKNTGYEGTEQEWLEDFFSGSLFAKNCIVSFDSDGGTPCDNQTVKQYTTVTEPQTPIKDGYTFDGWYYGNIKWLFPVYPVLNGMTLKAKWVGENFNVSFVTDSDECALEDMTISIGEAYTLPTPTKNGYRFLGWYVGDEPFTSDYLSTAIDGNVTLTAKWILSVAGINSKTLYYVPDLGKVVNIYDGHLTVRYTMDDSEESINFSLANETINFNSFIRDDKEIYTIHLNGTEVSFYLLSVTEGSIGYRYSRGGVSYNSTAYKMYSDIEVATLRRATGLAGDWVIAQKDGNETITQNLTIIADGTLTANGITAVFVEEIDQKTNTMIYTLWGRYAIPDGSSLYLADGRLVLSADGNSLIVFGTGNILMYRKSYYDTL